MHRRCALSIALAALAPAAAASPPAAPAPALATPAAPTPEQQATAETDRTSLREFETRRRAAATHPNELYRLYGAEAACKGEWRAAADQFRRAARYADKYSQHRLSLIYWHGLGQPADRALAYAWADLAAERRYPQFLLLREKIWLELSDAERERALREGRALYEQYGDAAAKPRFERALARARGQVTGSRTGASVDRVQVSASLGGGSLFDGGDSLDLRPIYAQWRLDAHRYWAVEDAIWQSGGSVEVGPLETLNGTP